MKGLKVLGIEEDGTAAEIGIEPGDEILSINGKPVGDCLSYRYLISSEKVTLLVKKAEGGLLDIDLEKDEGDDLGIVPEEMRIRRCGNKCVFCFVAQMPKGLRRSLYVKDEDYRHSFLYGNYITLTTMKDEDYRRIIGERLSPLYISVHATDDSVRRFLLANRKAPPIMENIKRLANGGITMHTQAVVCPCLNDGDVLIKTVEDLAAFYPKVASLAVVPVGITKHREGLYPLRTFTRSEARKLLDSLEPLRKKYRKKTGESFVYPSDELYIKAGYDFPKDSEYDGYPQIDNGVGLVRDFLTEFRREKRRLPKKPKALPCRSERSRGTHSCSSELKVKGGSLHSGRGDKLRHRRLILITGISFATYLKTMAEEISATTGIKLKVLPVKNELFGHTVTVTGLLSGHDIAAALKGKKAAAALVPSVAVRDGEGVFLDDMTPEEVEREAGVKIIMIEPTAKGLVEALKKGAHCAPNPHPSPSPLKGRWASGLDSSLRWNDEHFGRLHDHHW